MKQVLQWQCIRFTRSISVLILLHRCLSAGSASHKIGTAEVVYEEVTLLLSLAPS
jgi:hypothetical protein